jgi:uncharacterized protein (DUF1499 family)
MSNVEAENSRLINNSGDKRKLTHVNLHRKPDLSRRTKHKVITLCAHPIPSYAAGVNRSRIGSTVLLLGLLATLIGCRMSQPPILGVQSGRLLPCPAAPNCVCSQDPDPAHQIDPFTFTGSETDALNRLIALIEAEPRTRIIASTPGYLRAEFRSRIFRFVDDIEFSLEPAAQRIHVRSASRVGYSDLGVNRKRVEHLRAKFAAPQ